MNMTFREELVSYHFHLQRLKWMQDRMDQLKIDIAKSAELVCTHADAIKGQALLVTPDSESEIETVMEPFTVFILQPENWSKKDPTHNLKIETLTQVKSHPDVGSTPDSEIPA